MQYRSLIAALSAVAILSSCGNDNAQHENTTASPADTATHMLNTTDRSRPPHNDNDAVKSARAKIQGTWIDNSDPMSVLVFTADKQISIYDGKGMDTLVYEVTGVNCAPGNPSASPDGGLYLKTDMCYAITDINDQTLSLIYLERGNTLTYKRKK